MFPRSPRTRSSSLSVSSSCDCVGLYHCAATPGTRYYEPRNCLLVRMVQDLIHIAVLAHYSGLLGHWKVLCTECAFERYSTAFILNMTKCTIVDGVHSKPQRKVPYARKSRSYAGRSMLGICSQIIFCSMIRLSRGVCAWTRTAPYTSRRKQLTYACNNRPQQMQDSVHI